MRGGQGVGRPEPLLAVIGVQSTLQLPDNQRRAELLEPLDGVAGVNRSKLGGLYLLGVQETTSYVVIKTDARGNPQISEPNPDNWMIVPTSEGITLYWKTDWLSGVYKEELIPDPRTGERRWGGAYELVPSASLPGDWDIKACKAFGHIITSWTLQNPLPSFLHRVDDPRALEPIKTTDAIRREEWEIPPAKNWGLSYSGVRQHPPLRPHDDLIRLAAALTAAHPGDPYFEILNMDAQIAARDFTKLEAELNTWRDRLEHPSFLRIPFRQAETALLAYQRSMAGKNAYDFFVKLHDSKADLTQRFMMLSGVFHYREYVDPRVSVWPLNATNYQEEQTTAKIFGVLGCFQLLRGQRSQALDTFSASYRMGQLMNCGGDLMTRLIGMAVRAIACRGLELVALNGCETPSDAAAVWQRLEALNALEGPMPKVPRCSGWRTAPTGIPKCGTILQTLPNPI